MSSQNYFLNNQRTDINHLNYYYFTNVFTPEELVKIVEIGEKTPKTNATTVGT